MACTATIYNRTPPNWQLSLVEFGAVFAFRQGGTDSVGPSAFNVGSGGSADLSTNSPNCVYEVFFAFTVNTPLEPQPASYSITNTAPAGRCYGRTSITLAPKNAAIAEGPVPSNLHDILQALSLTIEADEEPQAAS